MSKAVWLRVHFSLALFSYGCNFAVEACIQRNASKLVQEMARDGGCPVQPMLRETGCHNGEVSCSSARVLVSFRKGRDHSVAAFAFICPESGGTVLGALSLK
jgi:hypothetical protein